MMHGQKNIKLLNFKLSHTDVEDGINANKGTAESHTIADGDVTLLWTQTLENESSDEEIDTEKKNLGLKVHFWSLLKVGHVTRHRK